MGRRVRGCGSARLRVRPGDDPVEHGESLLVEGHHAFGAEFPEGHLQPGAVSIDLVDAVQLEVAQLADA